MAIGVLVSSQPASINHFNGVNTSRNNRNVGVNTTVIRTTTPCIGTQIRNVGNRMLNAMSEFTSGKWATFPPMISSSTNSGVASVIVDHSVSRSNFMSQSFSVSVKQLARAQVNQGHALPGADRAVETGSFSFTISDGRMNHEFNIEVRAGDTNETIQQRLADAINSSNVGVTASITTGGDATERTTKLTLTSASTGAKSTFRVADIVGNLTQAMGIREVTQTAQNAIFKMGGRVREWSTNTVSLGAGAILNLNGIGKTEISLERDVDRAEAMIMEIINSINAGLRLPFNPNGVGGADRLVRDIRGALNTFSDDLARVGIHVRRNGEIRVDENALRSAIQGGEIGNLFSSGSPFMNRMERIANHAANTNRFTNAPVQVGSTNPFNAVEFGNSFTHWSIMNMKAVMQNDQPQPPQQSIFDMRL